MPASADAHPFDDAHPSPCPHLMTTLLLGLVLVLTSHEVNADMFGLFAKKYDVHLSPAVHGRITRHGEPVAGLTIIRDVEYGDSYTDKATTDADGRFEFGERLIQSTLPGDVFTQETRVIQEIYTQENSTRHLLWWSPQFGTIPNQAIADRLSQLNCDLATPEAAFYFPSVEYPQAYHRAKSLCRWPFGLGPNELPPEEIQE